jgi:hypothetical protein
LSLCMSTTLLRELKPISQISLINLCLHWPLRYVDTLLMLIIAKRSYIGTMLLYIRRMKANIPYGANNGEFISKGNSFLLIIVLLCTNITRMFHCDNCIDN